MREYLIFFAVGSWFFIMFSLRENVVTHYWLVLTWSLRFLYIYYMCSDCILFFEILLGLAYTAHTHTNSALAQFYQGTKVFRIFVLKCKHFSLYLYITYIINFGLPNILAYSLILNTKHVARARTIRCPSSILEKLALEIPR